MKIATLTLSPAFDVHCILPNFVVGKEHAATILCRSIGGKGINISRALVANGVSVETIVVTGQENQKEFSDALKKEGIAAQKISTAGRIRENITVRSDDGTETRISFSNDAVSPALLLRVKEAVDATLDCGDILCLAGSIPKGLPFDSLKKWLVELRSNGIRTVIDSRSFSSEDLVECHPWLIKPNAEEIAVYVGRPQKTPVEAMAAARTFFEKGIDNVMVSLGQEGAVLVCEEGSFLARPPKIHALSTIGAGDSAIAGFLAGALTHSAAPVCLCRAVAFGTAACLSEGTAPPRPEDVASIFPQVSIKTI